MYTYVMADDSVLDEIQDNTREAGQRLRASLNLMRSQSMTSTEDYQDLLTRLRTAMAMVEAAYVEAIRFGIRVVEHVPEPEVTVTVV
jgi:hypothetical protein